MNFDELREKNLLIAFTLFNPEPTGGSTIASIPTGVHGVATEYKCQVTVPGQIVSFWPRFYDKKCWLDYGGKLQFDSDWNWFMAAFSKCRDFLNQIERPSKNHCCLGDQLEVDVDCWVREFDLAKAFEALILLVSWIKKYKDENNSTKPEPSAPDSCNQ